MTNEQLFQAFEGIDEELLERSEQPRLSGSGNRRTKRFTAGLLAAALLVCILGTTAFASSQGISIVSMLSGFFAGNLSESQETALEPFGTTEFGTGEEFTSVTDAGVTVTPEMELYDGVRLMFKLRLDLDDGIELPELEGDKQYKLGHEVGYGGMLENINSYGVHWTFTHESVNVIYCTIDMQLYVPNQDLGDVLHLKGIWAPTDPGSEKMVIDGTWDIPLGNLEVQEAWEINVSGLPAVKQYQENDHSGEYRELRLTGCAVTPLTIRIDFEYFKYGQWIYHFNEIYAVTKSGEKINAGTTMVGTLGRNEDGSTWESSNLLWETPVNCQEIDYLQFDDLKVPVDLR